MKDRHSSRITAELVRQLEQYSKTTKPAIEVVLLKYVDATALGLLLEQLYADESFSAREGPMSITPLAAPNGLFLVGRPESVEKLKGLIGQLDKPLSPSDRFKVFRLKSVPADEARENITEFFAQEIPEETACLYLRAHPSQISVNGVLDIKIAVQGAVGNLGRCFADTAHLSQNAPRLQIVSPKKLTGSHHPLSLRLQHLEFKRSLPGLFSRGRSPRRNHKLLARCTQHRSGRTRAACDCGLAHYQPRRTACPVEEGEGTGCR